MIALGVLLIYVFMGLFAPFVAPYGPSETVRDEQGSPVSMEPPSLEHPMGTTAHANDVFSQWIYGSQVSLIVGLVAGLTVIFIGTTFGLIAGYYKGIIDMILMRVIDIMYAIPAVPLVLIIAIFFGSSLWNVIIAFGLILWRSEARAIRAQTLSLAERPFVKSAKAIGASDFRIMYSHILPNLIPLMLIELTFVAGSAIILEAGISFLGLGATEMISWGGMLEMTFATGAIAVAWWWVIPPGVSITMLVISLFYVSRGIESITNPEMTRQG